MLLLLWMKNTFSSWYMNPATALGGKCYYCSHVTDEGTEAQKRVKLPDEYVKWQRQALKSDIWPPESTPWVHMAFKGKKWGGQQDLEGFSKSKSVLWYSSYQGWQLLLTGCFRLPGWGLRYRNVWFLLFPGKSPIIKNNNTGMILVYFQPFVLMYLHNINCYKANSEMWIDIP